MIFSGGFCLLDFWPGILQGIIIHTWLANPLLSRDLPGESEKYTIDSQVLVSAQSLVNCAAFLHAASRFRDLHFLISEMESALFFKFRGIQRENTCETTLQALKPLFPNLARVTKS